MDAYQLVRKELDRLKPEFINSVVELVKIPSVYREDTSPYPFGESINQALEKTLQRCKQLGYKTYYDPDGYYGYAEIGEGEELFGILGHLDVVSEGRLEDWDTPPFDMRIPVTANKEELVTKLTDTAMKYNLAYEEFDYLPSIYIPMDSELVQTLLEAYQSITDDAKSQPITSGGATYARAMDNCIAFGAIFPNQEKVEHQPNEYMDIEKMMQAMEIYARAILQLTT
ncbi:M20/M25/M40 family metallo-hydrolase [Oceanobacillus halotolerans]|uniref:M20/M25/M40 family metallo-hydrolase n=1 Tax=Oceanobacillus halotolerans TaxID=2663380 RepID=UPI0013DA898B|nr:M20/M25/M40 family metallo-hydrolase [Oceanobacillus halotolerans]